MDETASFDSRSTLDKDENDRRWKQFFNLIESRGDRYGIPVDIRKWYELCVSNYMKYAQAMHSKNPICTMLVMQHRMSSHFHKLSLSKRVLVQIFRDMGDKVEWYLELGSSELEHVLYDLAPSTGIAAPTILRQPRYTTRSTLVSERLDAASLGSFDIHSHSSEAIISDAPATEEDSTSAEDGVVNEYHVTPEGSPVAPLPSSYIYSYESSDTVIPSTPTPAAEDPVPAENDSFVGALAPHESSHTIIPSTATPSVVEPMLVEDGIVNELAFEELSGAVAAASCTPTPAVEDPMPADDEIVDELASEDLSGALAAEDEIVDELATEGSTIPSISASESEGNQGNSEPLGSVWKLDNRYPNTGLVHRSARMASQPRPNYRF